jgi:hypothetical protein
MREQVYHTGDVRYQTGKQSGFRAHPKSGAFAVLGVVQDLGDGEAA